MRILITGGAGFIGSHLAGALGRTHHVTVFDSLASGHRENVPSGMILIQGDVRDGEALRRACADGEIEVMVHLAAQSNLRRSIEDPVLDASINVLGGVAALRACAESGVKRFIFASSGGAVYGEARRLPCREGDTARPRSPYGAAKLAVEGYARTMSRAAGFEAVSLRLGNVYGPRQDPAGEAGVVALFGRSMSNGVDPVIFGDGLQTRDFVYVKDVAFAFESALSAPPGIYNVGTGRETSILDIARHVAGETGFSGTFRFKPAIAEEIRRNALDITLAARRLGWRSATSLELGMAATVSSWKAVSDSRCELDGTGARAMHSSTRREDGGLSSDPRSFSVHGARRRTGEGAAFRAAPEERQA